jgi:hypothetical protein
MQLFTALLTALGALASSTTASPVAPAPAAIRRNVDIVYSPHVFEPAQGAKWQIGITEYVKWDTSNPPPGAENNVGTILLGFYNDTSGNEHLDYGEFYFGPHAPSSSVLIMSLHTCIAHPLASGFLLSSGGHPVTVPNVPTRSTYFVVRK